jgi:hypothetical protein
VAPRSRGRGGRAKGRPAALRPGADVLMGLAWLMGAATAVGVNVDAIRLVAPPQWSRPSPAATRWIEARLEGGSNGDP